ncbi:hypothetical protein SLS53_001335 [Cytospora paraplurivora]|uniref:MYB transcription factor n=1 Tax=Cytospora paraplurivora TaxID=2898453 RepID=A0AAN9YK42_9PEZI
MTAAITGGSQPVAGVAPSAGTLYAAPPAPPPPGAHPWLGGGGYAPAGAFGGGPGFLSTAPGGSGAVGLGLGLGLGPRGPPPASKRSMPPHTADSPAKKQSKWSPEEDALIIELRGRGMKWEDISKRLPGRSAISCRLHYQNYLERRSEWDEERKNKLARLYERFKPEMWAKVAEEMQVPWRAAEAMHWQLGEADMARRAGVVPFSLSSANVAQEAISNSGGNNNNLSSSNNNRQSPSRGHAHSQSQGSVPRSEHDYLLSRYQNRGRGAPPPPYQATHAHHHTHHQHLSHPPHPLTIPAPISTIPPPAPGRGGSGGGGPLAPRRESMPPRPPPGDFIYDSGSLAPGPGLAPIQPRERGGGGAGGGGVGGGMQLPGLAELTTGVSPYSTPAYSLGGTSASPSATASPRQAVSQGPTPLGYGEPPGGAPGSTKRGRSSPDAGRQATRRRH